MAISLGVQCVIGFLCGVASHVLIFIHGELDDVSVRIASALIFIWSLLMILSSLSSRSIFSGFVFGTVVFLIYLFGLVLSIGLYRVFFHPLRRFAGPRLYKLTQWRASLEQRRTARYFVKLRQQHSIYGDFVRSGPNHLSTRSLEAFRAIYAETSLCQRGPWHDTGGKKFVLQRTRDRQAHDQQRIFWQNGLTGHALDSYSERIDQQVQLLLDRLPSDVGMVNLTDELSFHGFNVMSAVTFSNTYDDRRRNEVLRILSLLEDAQRLLGILSPVPWAWSLLNYLPNGLGNVPEFYRASERLLRDRLQNPPPQRDLISALQDADDEPTAPGFPLSEESRLALTAGSQFNCTAPLPALFYLASNPRYLHQVVGEIEPDMKQGIFDMKKIYPLLESVIKESLRLMPPLPNGAQRKSPPLGLRIGDTWIPGGVIIKVPLYSLLRDERYFAHPDSFIPERWTTQGELVREKEAFAPFLSGAYSCVARDLALMHSRAVIANLIYTYDISLSQDAVTMDFENSGKDYYLVYYGALKVRLSRREKRDSERD